MGIFSKLFVGAEAVEPDGIYAPMAGKAVPLSQVPDPTFSEGMLGDGIAILPSSGTVCAPCSGTVENMFETGHAVCLKAENGAEILIHVGLETVGLAGKCFKICVKNGQKVKKGQKLMEADLDGIRRAGLETVTPVVVCNADDVGTLEKYTGSAVTGRDIVIRVKEKTL